MINRLSLILGIFVVMALSNAVVPVLPLFADEAPAVQGVIFSAYFLGAFLTVLPAGLLSDRIGKVPFIRAGLLLTLLSGILIILFPLPLPVIIARSIEGVGAGMFIACALSWVNSQEDHTMISGYFFAALNLGLVTGLIAAGWLEPALGMTGGIALFTAISVFTLVMSIFMPETTYLEQKRANLLEIMGSYKWLFVSAIVFVGATGVVTVLYPEFTNETPALLSIQIGMMNIATIVTSLLAPRFDLKPIPTIKAGALLMATAVLATFFTPGLGSFAVLIGFAVIGSIAGFIIIAQVKFLAETRLQQGAVMGLFNTSTYAGMTFLPFIAGVIAQVIDFFSAFLVIAIITACMAVTIGWCNCRGVAVS